MDLDTRTTAFVAGTSAGFVLGIVLAVVGNETLNLVGLGLIVLSAVLFVPTMKNLVVEEHRAERNRQ